MHLLLISAAELGFAWDGDESGWMRLVSFFFLDDDWSHSAFLLLHFGCLALSCICLVGREECFRRVQSADLKGSLQLPTSSHLRNRDKNVVKSHLMWRGMERIPSRSGQEG